MFNDDISFAYGVDLGKVKPAYETSGPSDRRLRFLSHEVTRGFSNPSWMGCSC